MPTRVLSGRYIRGVARILPPEPISIADGGGKFLHLITNRSRNRQETQPPHRSVVKVPRRDGGFSFLRLCDIRLSVRQQNVAVLRAALFSIAIFRTGPVRMILSRGCIGSPW